MVVEFLLPLQGIGLDLKRKLTTACLLFLMNLFFWFGSDPIGRRAILDHFDRHGISSGLQTLAKFIFVPDLASDFYWPHLNLRGFDLAMMNGLLHVDKDEKELVDMPEPVIRQTIDCFGMQEPALLVSFISLR